MSTCPVRKPLHLLELRRLNMADFISQRWLLNRREVLRGLGVSLACRCSNACSHCEAPGRMLGPVAVSSSTLPAFSISESIRMTSRWRRRARTMSFRGFLNHSKNIRQASRRSVDFIILTHSVSLIVRPRPGSPAPSTAPQAGHDLGREEPGGRI